MPQRADQQSAGPSQASRGAAVYLCVCRPSTREFLGGLDETGPWIKRLVPITLSFFPLVLPLVTAKKVSLVYVFTLPLSS